MGELVKLSKVTFTKDSGGFGNLTVKWSQRNIEVDFPGYTFVPTYIEEMPQRAVATEVLSRDTRLTAFPDALRRCDGVRVINLHGNSLTKSSPEYMVCAPSCGVLHC